MYVYATCISIITNVRHPAAAGMTQNNILIMQQLAAHLCRLLIELQPEEAQAGRPGQENVRSIMWIAVVSETSSPPVGCPNSSSSFHLKEKITRMIV